MNLGQDAQDEYRGVQLAVQMVNRDGGIGGRQVVVDLKDVESVSQIAGAVASFKAEHTPVVLGAYSSSLSVPAATAVAQAGMVYWETGAEADQVTGQGSPLVFRVGADGADLGGNSGRFVVQQLAPRVGGDPHALTAFLVTADDQYAHSVSDGARSALTAGGIAIAGEAVYNPYYPDWTSVLAAVKRARPSFLLVSSHVPDGIAFRKAFLAAGVHVDAFIGTTMAQCDAFGAALGAQAVGVFASDRPEYGFNPSALTGQGLALYQQFDALWRQSTGSDPSQEAISGFSSAWVLLHDVLRAASASDPHAIAAAAASLNIPDGSLPNGAGVLFSSSPGILGQNVRAAADIWQWQAPDHYVVVWPPSFATGALNLSLSPSSPAPGAGSTGGTGGW